MVTGYERRIAALEKKYQTSEPTSNEDDRDARWDEILEVVVEAHGAFKIQGPHYPIGPDVRSTVALAIREVGRSGPFTVERAIPAVLDAVEQWPDVRDFVIKGFIEKGLLPSPSQKKSIWDRFKRKRE